MGKYKSICFCVDRPDNGPSGGGAGIMFLLRKYLGIKCFDCEIDYLYRNHGRFCFVLKLVLKTIRRKNTYYISHDPGSAAVLSLLRQDYSLVYHQQGPMVQEYINFTDRPRKWKIWRKKHIEKRAFLNAKSVHFPSSGAENEYFNSSHATVKRNMVNIGSRLYNTINEDEEMIPVLQFKPDVNSLTFLSVGTMTELKGQDLSLKFIKAMLGMTERKICWITVGDGLLKEIIAKECEILMQENSRFMYIHFDTLPHGSVVYLDSISDVYLMLHRTSIFDLSTLEAMCQRCAVILSNVGGNKEFNIKDNCILADINHMEDAVNDFLRRNIDDLKMLNKQVYDQYFNPACFREAYMQLIKNIINRLEL